MKRTLASFTSAVALAAAGLLPIQAAHGQSAPFPSKPINLLFGTVAGGPNDLICRILALYYEKEMGQPVVVEARPGAGERAASIVAKAPADGQTLVLGGYPTVTLFVKEVSFDPLKDLTAVSIVARQYYFLLAGRSMNVATVQDVVAHAKSTPNSITAAYVVASPHEVEMNALVAALGIKMILVPYKGLAQVTPAQLSGEVGLTLGSTPPQVKTGELVALAVGGEKRNAAYPNVPTFRESGINYDPQTFFLLNAPAATPRPIVAKLSAVTADAAKSPEFADRITKVLNIDGFGSTPEFAAQFIREDFEGKKKIADIAGIKPQ